MLKKIHIVFSLLILLIVIEANGQVVRNLNIPGRLQWANAGGYCGETSIQMIGLYFGNYISQDIIRTVAGGELLVRANDAKALDNLAFTYEEWDVNQTKPHYQKHLIWLKQHLYNYHPVIITVFVRGGRYSGYDHIIPAVGFSGSDLQTFQNSDQLSFHSCYSQTCFTRTFESVWDTRSMSENGSLYNLCLPKDRNCGTAVTGIKDELNTTKPVYLSIDRWDEPNVTLGENPVLLNGVITIDSLSIGRKYALLRYNSYTKVPSKIFIPSEADASEYFIATKNTKTISNTFMSNSSVFYRCIPYEYDSTLDLSKKNTDKNYNVYPNPTNDYLIIETPKKCQISILNSRGQCLERFISQETKNTIPLKGIINGVYIIRFTSPDETTTRTFIKK